MEIGTKFIALDKLTATLEALAQSLALWVPLASDDQRDVVRFMPYQTGLNAVLSRQSSIGPKKVILPQVETLFRFSYHKTEDDPGTKQVQLDNPSAPGPTLIFGACPCDVKGLLVFDQVFTNGPATDELYLARREQTLIATLVCQAEDAACFCSSVGGGPADMAGSDIRLTAVTGGYVVEPLNEKAHTVIQLLPEAADQAQITEAVDIQQQVQQRQVGSVDPEPGKEAFQDRFEDLQYWRQVAGQCLSCGVCTFLCPTCYCFTISDEMKETRGERIRSWDSCMFYNYTLEASGHNPRPTRLERYRNRIGHKFNYFPDKYQGMIACSGCGRCIRNCPVSIDIRKAVEHLKENAHACVQPLSS